MEIHNIVVKPNTNKLLNSNYEIKIQMVKSTNKVTSWKQW